LHKFNKEEKQTASHVKHGPFRNLLLFYDNLDALDRML